METLTLKPREGNFTFAMAGCLVGFVIASMCYFVAAASSEPTGIEHVRDSQSAIYEGAQASQDCLRSTIDRLEVIKVSAHENKLKLNAEGK